MQLEVILTDLRAKFPCLKYVLRPQYAPYLNTAGTVLLGWLIVSWISYVSHAPLDSFPLQILLFLSFFFFLLSTQVSFRFGISSSFSTLFRVRFLSPLSPLSQLHGSLKQKKRSVTARLINPGRINIYPARCLHFDALSHLQLKNITRRY